MFSLEILEREHHMDSPEGKTAFFQEAARRLISFQDELERNNYIEAVAKAYRISEESLKKLVSKTAVREGMAKPVERPKAASGKPLKKEDGSLTAQKVLLTWMIDDPRLFGIISSHISPGDFTQPQYRTVAELLYEQYRAGSLNPAKIINHFTEEEEHREAAALFNTRIGRLTTPEEKVRAIKDSLLRVKSNSIDVRMKNLDPTDMAGPAAPHGRKKTARGIGETAYFFRIRIKYNKIAWRCAGRGRKDTWKRTHRNFWSV